MSSYRGKSRKRNRKSHKQRLRKRKRRRELIASTENPWAEFEGVSGEGLPPKDALMTSFQACIAQAIEPLQKHVEQLGKLVHGGRGGSVATTLRGNLTDGGKGPEAPGMETITVRSTASLANNVCVQCFQTKVQAI